jgi:purine-binding chemotaxis protein CheW
MADQRARLLLLCRIPICVIALPVEHVRETMRPLPIVPLTSEAPAFVKGISIIRGEPIPILDPCRLFNGRESCPGRFVTIRVGSRTVALVVDEVIGIQIIGSASLASLPPLLQHARAEAICAIGKLDVELLTVLNTASLLPENPPGDAVVEGVSV